MKATLPNAAQVVSRPEEIFWRDVTSYGEPLSVQVGPRNENPPAACLGRARVGNRWDRFSLLTLLFSGDVLFIKAQVGVPLAVFPPKNLQESIGTRPVRKVLRPRLVVRRFFGDSDWLVGHQS